MSGNQKGTSLRPIHRDLGERERNISKRQKKSIHNENVYQRNTESIIAIMMVHRYDRYCDGIQL